MFQRSFAADENVGSNQECLFPDLVEEVAGLRDVRGLELPKPLRLRILGQPETGFCDFNNLKIVGYI